MTWYCLSYNDCPRCIFQAESLEEAEKNRVKYQKWLDEKMGYEYYYIYCEAVPLFNEVIK